MLMNGLECCQISYYFFKPLDLFPKLGLGLLHHSGQSVLLHQRLTVKPHHYCTEHLRALSHCFVFLLASFLAPLASGLGLALAVIRPTSESKINTLLSVLLACRK